MLFKNKTVKKTVTNFALQDELIQINEELQKQDELFDMVDDEDLIEAIIYEKKALISRYNYLIKKARAEKISISFIEREFLKNSED